MSFSDFKSTIQSTAVDTLARVSEHAEPVIETAIHLGKQGKEFAGTVILGALNNMDKAESFYYNQVPEIESTIETTIRKIKLAWEFTVNLAIVLYGIGSDLAEPWARLFRDASDLWDEKAAPTYWSAKDSLSAFYHTHWGYTQRGFKLDEPSGVLAVNPNTPFNKTDNSPRTIAASVSASPRIRIQEPASTDDAGSFDQPDKELVGLTPEIIKSKTLRELRPIASKLSILNYGHMNKASLEQSIINKLKL